MSTVIRRRTFISRRRYAVLRFTNVWRMRFFRVSEFFEAIKPLPEIAATLALVIVTFYVGVATGIVTR